MERHEGTAVPVLHLGRQNKTPKVNPRVVSSE